MGGWTKRVMGLISLLSVLAAPMAMAGASAGAMQLAQNDLLLSGPFTSGPADGAGSSNAPPVTESISTPAVSASVPTPAAPQQGLRIVLLLPARSQVFHNAAQAVREGVELAARRDPDPALSLRVVETGDDTAETLNAFQAAQQQADLVIGPLTRSGVTAVAQRARVDKPTLALAQPEQANEGEVRLPPRMLSIGLSVEEEARQAARQAVADGHQGRAYIIASASAWQRRAARAFADEWRRLRQLSEGMEISASGQWLDIAGLQQLKRRLENEQPALIFVALDADQASQLREAVGRQVPMIGTSQLNPLPAGDWPVAARKPELNGVQLLDMPWLIEPAHPAVMAYRSQPVTTRSADLERLVALGIDAWRVAREIAGYKSSFELDGVTGRLLVEFGGGSNRLQRNETPAEYQDGMVVPAQR